MRGGGGREDPVLDQLHRRCILVAPVLHRYCIVVAPLLHSRCILVAPLVPRVPSCVSAVKTARAHRLRAHARTACGRTRTHAVRPRADPRRPPAAPPQVLPSGDGGGRRGGRGGARGAEPAGLLRVPAHGLCGVGLRRLRQGTGQNTVLVKQILTSTGQNLVSYWSNGFVESDCVAFAKVGPRTSCTGQTLYWSNRFDRFCLRRGSGPMLRCTNGQTGQIGQILTRMVKLPTRPLD